MSDIAVSQRIVFNPVSKTIIDTQMVPVCQFYSEAEGCGEGQLDQRASMLSAYGSEVLQNGGELSVTDNGDIAVSKNHEEIYTSENYNGFMLGRDYFYFNVSSVEYELMSQEEQQAHVDQIKQSVYKRYIDPEIAIKFQGPEEDRAIYFAAIADIDSVVVTVSIEKPLTEQLTHLLDNYGGNTISLDTFISSSFINTFLSHIKVQQLSISLGTDIRFQLFGVIKNMYPFVYFKNGVLYDMGLERSDEYDNLDDLRNGININSNGLFDKELAVNKKDLMCICKQINTIYIAVPVGRYKEYALQDARGETIVGSEELVGTVDILTHLPAGISIIRDRSHPGYVDTTIAINNEVAANMVQRRLNRGFEETWGFVPDYIGTKSQNQSQQVSRFYLDYGFSVPILASDVQTSETIRFKSAPKFAILFVYENDGIGTTFDYYINKGVYMAQIKTMQVSDVKYRGIKDFAPLQPFLSQSGEGAAAIEKITRETWTKREYEYEHKRIDTQYVKGDYIYMTKMKGRTSAAFVALTLGVSLSIPTSATLSNNTPIFSTKDITVYLKSVFKVSNMNDYYQTRDLVMNHRFNMLSHLYSLYESWVQHEMQISNISSSEELQGGTRHAIQASAIKRATIDLKIEDKRAFDEIYPRRERTLHQIFARTFNVTEEIINLTETNNIYDLDEIDYMYELKTFSMARQEKDAYSMHSRIVYNPIDLPVDFTIFNDFRDSEASTHTLYLSALVPHVAGALDRGGGFIGKLEYKINAMDVLKYVVTRSRDFTSGLSNSEQARWEIHTMCSDGTERTVTSEFEELLLEHLPSRRKEISLTYREIASEIDEDGFQNAYLSSPIITNLIVDHNWLSETSTIKMNILAYEKGEMVDDPLA